MAEEQKHHHHHHHHHHKVDEAQRFHERSMRAIRLRKLISKWAFRVLVVVAVVMVAYAVVIYMIR